MVPALVELRKATFIAQRIIRKGKVQEGIRVFNVYSVSDGGSCMRGVMVVRDVQGALQTGAECARRKWWRKSGTRSLRILV